MTVSAIYKISNAVDNKSYIGSAVNYEQRIYLHRNSLKKGKHTNIHLQRAFNKYGEDNFKFEIIEVVNDKEKLIEREQWHIDNYNFLDLYNIAAIAGSPLGTKRTEESKLKMKNAKLGKPSNNLGSKYSEETKLKMSKSKQNMSDETKLKISKGNTGKRYSNETKEKMSKSKLGKPSGNLGNKHSEESRLKISKGNSKPILQIDKHTDEIIKVWSSATEAAKALGIAGSTISSICSDTVFYNKAYNRIYFIETSGGYKWQFANEEDKPNLDKNWKLFT